MAGRTSLDEMISLIKDIGTNGTGSLEEIISSFKDVRLVEGDPLDKVLSSLNDATKELRSALCTNDLEAVNKMSRKLEKLSMYIHVLQALICNKYLEDYKNKEEPQEEESIDRKKKRKDHLTILCHVFELTFTNKGKPCNLYVVPSPDKKGRYVLEDKETKIRSNTTTKLSKLKSLRYGIVFRSSEAGFQIFRLPIRSPE